MGIVYEMKDKILTQYPMLVPGAAGMAAGNENVDFATVELNAAGVAIQQEAFSPGEFDRLLRDLDSMARTRGNEEVAALVADAVPSILVAARAAKVESASEYGGQRATGTKLVATWLRPPHIGDTNITNDSSSAASLGLYGGTGATVYSWQPTVQWTAGTAKTIYPSQKMKPESAVVVIGYMETVSAKVGAYRFTLEGTTTSVLPLRFSSQRRGSHLDPMVAKLYEPVIFRPKGLYAADLYPNETGIAAPEMLAVLIAPAKFLTA